MSQTISLKAALLGIVSMATLAAGLGYALGASPAPKEDAAREEVLAQVKPAPTLPDYTLAAGWSSLPTPPPPAEPKPEGEESIPATEETYVPAPESTVTEGTSSGESSGGRPHGITIGP